VTTDARDPALPAPSTNIPVAARPIYHTPLSIWLYVAGTWVVAWWLLYDGLHARLWGDFTRINGQLGPWAGLARAAGIDPQQLALLFVALGSALLGASFGVMFRRRWGYYSALLLSAALVLYLGFGTPVALVCLVLLLLPASRRHILF
jgi:hypothetical protein